MKRLTLVLAVLALLGLCAPSMAQSWDVSALKVEVSKGLPGSQVLAASADDRGGFVGVQQDGKNYQFTLAADGSPHLMDAQELQCGGHKAFFFEPIPGSGGLMIVLGEEKSLTILCSAGMASDTDITADDLTAIAERMDLDAL